MSSVYDAQLLGEQLVSIAAGSSAQTPGATIQYVQPKRTHTLYVVAVGTPTGGVVAIDISPDGINWLTTNKSVTVNANGVFSVTLVDTVAQWVRANVTTAITGGTGTISAVIAGVN